MIKAYADQLPPLHAERQMLALEAAASPYMKQTDRSAILDRYARLIRGDTQPRQRRSLLDAFAELGLKTVEVPTKEVKRNVRRARKSVPRA